MIKCLVFDLDDTLYSEHEYVLSGFRAVSSFLYTEYGVSGFYDEASRLFHAKERGNIFNQVLSLLDVDYSDTQIKRLVNIYREHKPEITLFSDAVWALNYYSGKMDLGLITDGYLAAQQSKIKALDISPYFKSIVITDALGREYWKPHKKPYLTIQDEVHAEAEACIYVGDNVTKDFVTANRLGWQTIQILREQGEYANADVSKEYKAQVTISSLKELPKVILE